MSIYNYEGRISITSATFTIASGATTSQAIDLQGHGLVSLQMPSALTSIAMTFQGSHDNSNFFDLHNTDGTKLTVTVGTSRIILFYPTDFIGIPYLKLVAGSTEGGTRSILAVLRSFQ